MTGLKDRAAKNTTAECLQYTPETLHETPDPAIYDLFFIKPGGGDTMGFSNTEKMAET